MPWWPTRGSWAPRLLWFNLHQQNPVQSHAVRLVIRRSPPMFPPAIWNVHDASQRWSQNQQHVRGLEQQVLLPGRTCPSVYGLWSSGVKRKKLLSSEMPLLIHQLSVLNRDMFSSRSVYITYAETSLLARRPMPSSCVELGGISDSITNISA